MQQRDANILKKYDGLLQEYANRVMPHFPAYLEKQRQPFNPFFKKLFDFYLFTSYLIDSKLFPDDDKLVGLRVLFAKGCLSFFGIYSCLQNGLSSEGAVLLRSLFETLLNEKLILAENTEERAKLFYEFHFVEKWNNLEANRRLLREGKTTQATFDKTYDGIKLNQVTQDYDRVKSNYHPTRPYHWAWTIFKSETKGNNPSISFIADKLGFAEDYVKVYQALSLSVHGSPNILNLVRNEKGISMAPNFTRTVYT
ncbi:MAG: DUF5677 domain-containing protein, partial [Bacteroidota bacterium]